MAPEPFDTLFVDERCHACGAYLHLFPDNTIECLNLCSWPHWMVLRFQIQMAEVNQAIARKEQIVKEVLAVL